jgi:uncharacterized protein (TIGR00661 family)
VLELKTKMRMDEFIAVIYKEARRPGHAINMPTLTRVQRMARVLYGVMGNTYGHVARTLAIVTRLPEHEFHFIGGGRVPELLGKAYPVLKVPVKRTIHKNGRVSVPATAVQLLRCLFQSRSVRRQILDLIQRWQPDLAICDREIFLPPAARAAGLECISLDHSHVLPACNYPVPPAQRISWSLAHLEDSLFFNFTRHNLIVSFFHPELKSGKRQFNELLPPVLRPEVRQFQPTPGNHILIYQTNPTFTPLLAAVRQLARPAIIYGFRNTHATEGNLIFKPFHPQTILANLASCAYAVVNGGHNLICEALAYHKPLLCFPIAGQFEQFLNAWQVREMGFGDFSTSRHPAPEIFHEFESRLGIYRQNIQAKFVDGTDVVINRVRQLINASARNKR